MSFGDYIREKRLSLGYTLREFCRKFKYDVAYISRLENGFVNPPIEQDKLFALASAYEIKKNSDELNTFLDLAAAVKGEIPKDIQNNSNTVDILPAFYRTLRKKDINEEDIKRLVKIFKEGKAE